MSPVSSPPTEYLSPLIASGGFLASTWTKGRVTPEEAASLQISWVQVSQVTPMGWKMDFKPHGVQLLNFLVYSAARTMQKSTPGSSFRENPATASQINTQAALLESAHTPPSITHSANNSEEQLLSPDTRQGSPVSSIQSPLHPGATAQAQNITVLYPSTTMAT